MNDPVTNGRVGQLQQSVVCENYTRLMCHRVLNVQEIWHVVGFGKGTSMGLEGCLIEDENDSGSGL